MKTKFLEELPVRFILDIIAIDVVVLPKPTSCANNPELELAIENFNPSTCASRKLKRKGFPFLYFPNHRECSQKIGNLE